MMRLNRAIATITFLTVSAFSQAIPFVPPEVERLELLKSTREDVVKLLAGKSLNVGGYDHSQSFFMDDWIVRVDYSKGGCTDDWNVPEWTVTEVLVSPKDHIPLKDLSLDTSKFRKERNDPQRKNIYVLYDKPAGIAFYVSGGRAETLIRKVYRQQDAAAIYGT